MEKDLITASEFTFTARPLAVPYNYRISYKIGLLLLIMGMSCKRGGCSLLKLNLISRGLVSKKERASLLDFANDRISESVIVRFDPTINRALNYALAEQLVKQQGNGLFIMTAKGKAFFQLITYDDGILKNEKKFLNELSNKMTEDKIVGVTSQWRYDR